nr:unnamed protein product [Haemonchus contortus]
MTDKVRQVFLDKHNEYRSLVAKGEAKDAFGGNAPKATKMSMLTYDCGIESKALAWIKKCVYDSARLDKSLNLGENLYMLYDPHVDKAKAANVSSSAWFSSLQIVGVGPANVFTRDVLYRGAGYYTQMVWQKTRKLGCAVVSCNSMTLIGCLYNPR